MSLQTVTGAYMRGGTGIRRVIVVVLDGLRPDAIDRFDLIHTRRLMQGGASSLGATTIAPSVTAAAMTSLLTGVSPTVHGITGDRFHIPRGIDHLTALPELLARHALPSSAFIRQVPALFKGVAARIGRRLGFGSARLAGKTAADILAGATGTLRAQGRGLILLHWPDADRAGHASGWMSAAYAEGCRQLDASLGELATMTDVENDPSTLLMALADHGGGGAVRDDHESDHPLDRTIPLIIAGGAVVPTSLDDAHLLDVPATAVWALGLDLPPTYEGRVLTEAFGILADRGATATVASAVA